MLCKNLKVVNLNISEDNYEYRALFRLCAENTCMDIDLEKLSEDGMLEEIRESLSIEESIDVMKGIIMQKIMDASKLESKISEGENCCKEVTDKKVQKDIDSLSTS